MEGKNGKPSLLRRVFRLIFPASLWTRRFTAAWTGSFLSVMAFDIIWCSITNYRPMGFVSTYLFAAMLALVMALPGLGKRHSWVQLVVLLVCDGIMEANLMYCRTYFEAIPPSSYLLGANVAQFTESIVASLSWTDIVLPLLAVATWLWMRAAGQRSADRRGYLYTLTVAIALCIVCALIHGGMTNHITRLQDECYKRAMPPVLYTLPGTFLAELQQTIIPVSAAERTFAENTLEQRRQLARDYESVPSTPSQTVERRNLVFVIVESLESWPIGQTAEGQMITPNLTRWVADSTTWYAPRVFSQAGRGRSIDGQLLMTTGLFPTTQYVFSMRYEDSSFPSLAKELRRAVGAKSYLLSGDRANTWNQSVAARAFGIDDTRYRSSWDTSESFSKPRNPSDGSMMRQITDKMKAGEIWPEGENALVEIITYSMHFPFNIPEEHRKILLKDSYPPYLAEYITAVNYTDAALGTLVSYLKSRSDWPETMVVIAGDHEGLANARKEITGTPGFGQTTVDASTHVPMIVLNAPVPGHYESEMGQVDIYSTALGQMGIVPEWPGLGFSALSPLSPGIAAGSPEQTPDADMLPNSPEATDSLRRAVRTVVERQPRTGNAVIAADLLKNTKYVK